MHNDAHLQPRIALVIMPAWVTIEPAHSLAIVAAIAHDVGIPFSVHDLNIEFYHAISDSERKAWGSDEITLWSGVPAASYWNKYEPWLFAQIDRILADKPTMICFSVNMWTRMFSVNSAKYIKSKSPETVIMFGGVDCFFGEYNKNFLTENACDIICQGEAEIAFYRFLNEYKNTGNWRTDIPGFAFLADGDLIDTGRVELSSLQEHLFIPAYEYFSLANYTNPGNLPFFLTRGCPYNCRFCSETVNFSRFRCRRPEEAFEELSAVAAVARQFVEVPVFHFSDSIFNANVKRLERFTDLIIENGLNIGWGAQGHFHSTLTTELIHKLKQSGLRGVFWGWESGSQKIVDLMNKSYKQKDARRIIDDCSSAGIAQYLPVLMGFPGEEPEDVVDTIEYILEYRDKPGVQFFQPSPVLVRPNAELRENYRAYGLASNGLMDWSTTDGRNTQHVRFIRCFVTAQAQANRALTVSSLCAADFFSPLNLNEESIARDLFGMLAEIARRSKQTSILEKHVAALRPAERLSPSPRSWRHWLSPRVMVAALHDTTTPMALFGKSGGLEAALDAWLETDKNPPQARDAIVQLILTLLTGLRNRVVDATPSSVRSLG
jgi:hypothetical protein